MISRDGLSFVLRVLRRNFSFASLVIICLALGIGANTSLFAIISSNLLVRLPYPTSERLVFVWENNKRNNWLRAQPNRRNLQDLIAQNTSFEVMAGYLPTGFTL